MTQTVAFLVTSQKQMLYNARINTRCDRHKPQFLSTNLLSLYQYHFNQLH